jgi:hypothetical protein
MAFDPVMGDLCVVDNFSSTPVFMNGDVRVFSGKTGACNGSFGETQANLSEPLGLVFHPITGNPT